MQVFSVMVTEPNGHTYVAAVCSTWERAQGYKYTMVPWGHACYVNVHTLDGHIGRVAQSAAGDEAAPTPGMPLG